MPREALYFLVFVLVLVGAYMLWTRMQAGDVGGLTFAQAGASKQSAVDTAAASAASDGGATT